MQKYDLVLASYIRGKNCGRNNSVHLAAGFYRVGDRFHCLDPGLTLLSDGKVNSLRTGRRAVKRFQTHECLFPKEKLMTILKDDSRMDLLNSEGEFHLGDLVLVGHTGYKKNKRRPCLAVGFYRQGETGRRIHLDPLLDISLDVGVIKQQRTEHRTFLEKDILLTHRVRTKDQIQDMLRKERRRIQNAA